MNDALNPLRRAMAAADQVDERFREVVTEELGLAAVSAALAESRPEPTERAKAEAEAQRQRDLDAALADAIDAVARHRARLKRAGCSAHDAKIVRQVFELLRGLAPGADE